eukprot:1987107-Rhodomonas_salina.4
MEIDENDEPARVDSADVEVILEDEEGSTNEANTMQSMTREPSQGGLDLTEYNASLLQSVAYSPAAEGSEDQSDLQDAMTRPVWHLYCPHT